MFGIFEKKSTEPKKSIVHRVSESFGWSFGGTSATAPALDNQTALETSAVLCAVKTISEGIASTPLRVMENYTDSGLDKVRVARNHWANRLVNNPNGFMTASDFWEMAAAAATLGKGFMAIKVQVKDEIRELIPVPSGSWVMEILNDFTYQFRVTQADGRQVIYGQNAVFYFKGLSLDGYSGISSIEKARKAVGIASALEGQQLQTSAMGGRPSGCLTFENPLTPDQAKGIQEAWNSKFGPNGQGGIAVLDGKTTFSQMQQNAVDSQFIENRKFQVAEIARIFKINIAFMGDAPITAELMRWHITNSLRPWYVRIEQALNKQILNNDPKYFADFDELDLLRGNHQAMGTFFKDALGAGGSQAWMSVNECRAEMGLNPINEEWAIGVSKGGYELSAAAKDKG
ncbi:phage portal protein [Pseudogemmobacter bohemicus]|uniref:phage portal protein n=1 Tax=Pseudogemmobacter bohemicus TaxID=2250708 RepID=UPI000DD31FC1|nr:phage portal protein [Pseudogemmobacter bohemicus]